MAARVRELVISLETVLLIAVPMKPHLPYPGLRSFRPDESPYFFGRETEVNELLDSLDSSPVLMVVGPSGSGKSSLVRAGVLGALGNGFNPRTGSWWRVAEMRPGRSPLRNLARSLLKESALGRERNRPLISVDELQRLFSSGPRGLQTVMQESPLPARTRLLLLVDQYDEIFRYDPINLAETQAFVDLLIMAVTRRELGIHVILTLRSEFLDRADLYPDLTTVSRANPFLLRRMTPDQLNQAITGPAARIGGVVAPKLLRRMQNELGLDPEPLPLLQHALMRMGETRLMIGSGHQPGMELPDFQLNLQEYQRIGGLSGALAQHADFLFESLSAHHQAVAKTIFCQLTHTDPARIDHRRPVSLKKVKEIVGASNGDVESVVNVFRHPDCGFLEASPNELESESILDIRNEVLIRRWGRLQDWMRQEAASAQYYKGIEQTACLWIAGQSSPWGGNELELALGWWRHPSRAAWAVRYGNCYSLVDAFLAASEQNQEVTQYREVRALRRSRRKGLVAVVLAFALIAALFYGVTLGLIEVRRSVDASQLAKRAANAAESAAETARAAEAKAQALEAKARAEEARQREAAADARAEAETLRAKALIERKESERLAELAAAAEREAQKQRSRAQRTEQLRVQDLFDAQLAQASLLLENKNYVKAAERLRQSQAWDSQVSSASRHARDLLTWFADYSASPPSQHRSLETPLQDIALSPDGNHLAVAGENGAVLLFDHQFDRFPPKELLEPSVVSHN